MNPEEHAAKSELYLAAAVDVLDGAGRLSRMTFLSPH